MEVWKYTCCATDSRHLFAYFTDYIVMAYGRTGCSPCYCDFLVENQRKSREDSTRVTHEGITRVTHERIAHVSREGTREII